MKQYLATLIEGKELSREDTREIMVNITKEKYNEHQISALLMGIRWTARNGQIHRPQRLQHTRHRRYGW